jgi:hypothetical protein
MSEAIFGFIGVIVGAITAIVGPIIIDSIKEKNNKKNCLSSLLDEIRYNENTAQLFIEQDLTLGYLNKLISVFSYEKAKETGAICTIPTDVRLKIHTAYEKTLRVSYLINQAEIEENKIIKILGNLEDVPKYFRSAAEDLRKIVE